MKTGEIYKFAFNDLRTLLFFNNKNDAILNRNSSNAKSDRLNNKVFTVIDCEASPFDFDELIVQVLFDVKKTYFVYHKRETLMWNQIKKIEENE